MKAEHLVAGSASTLAGQPVDYSSGHTFITIDEGVGNLSISSIEVVTDNCTSTVVDPEPDTTFVQVEYDSQTTEDTFSSEAALADYPPVMIKKTPNKQSVSTQTLMTSTQAGFSPLGKASKQLQQNGEDLTVKEAVGLLVGHMDNNVALAPTRHRRKKSKAMRPGNSMTFSSNGASGGSSATLSSDVRPTENGTTAAAEDIFEMEPLNDEDGDENKVSVYICFCLYFEYSHSNVVVVNFFITSLSSG